MTGELSPAAGGPAAGTPALRASHADRDRAVDILRVEISGQVRGGTIVARPPRRTFWHWLRR